MKDHAPRDHQGTLAWLDDSLEWARSRDQTRLVELLNLVRTEVLFDINSPEGPWSIRSQTSRKDPMAGPNRVM